MSDPIARHLPPLALSLAAIVLLSPPAAAQTVEVTVDEENFRQEPMGKRLGTVRQGTRLRVAGSDGRWRQVVLEGWVWTPSVAASDRPGYDLVVASDGGENLRAEPAPDGRVQARLLEGFLLTRIGERGDWTRVRRTGWMWMPSMRTVDGSRSGSPAGGGGSGGGGSDGSGSGAGDGSGSGGPGADGGAAAGSDRMVVREGPARLHISPDGDTVGVARTDADLEVLERRGDWTRVRLEGWVREADVAPVDSAGVAEALTPAAVREAPDRHVGRRVRWTVQFVSLERAEEVRTDFYEGEPFLLARPAGSGFSGFVYLAVPPEMLPQVEKLKPLQTIEVLARIRTGRSALMGAPVAEVIDFVPR